MMHSNIVFHISFLFIITSFTNCCRINKLQGHNLQITFIDSTNYSGQVVSALVHQTDNQTFAYVAGEKNTVEAYTITPQGKLDLLEQYQITNQFGGIRALTKLGDHKPNFLILGNKADNSIEIHQIEKNGNLKLLNSIFDTDSTFIDETVTIHPITINNRTFIYAGGLDKGISCFELNANDSLHHVQSIPDNDSLFLHGIIGMSSLSIGKKTFLFTGSFFDGGLSSFQVLDNGHLKNTSNILDDNTLFLNGTFPVNTVQLGKQNFLLVGHRHKLHYSTPDAENDYHGDGVNVFKVNEQGQIKPHSTLKDNDKLKLKGSTRIELIKINEDIAYVFIGTRDDKGVQICSLHQDGILQPIQSIDLGYSIYNGMTLKEVDNHLLLLIGAYDKNLIEIYSVNYQ